MRIELARTKLFGGLPVPGDGAASEAAALFLRANPRGQELFASIERRHGRGRAMSILAHKLGRAVYFMLERNRPFDAERFYRTTAA